ncbi:hypothetical protein GbCGDNIH6_8309 [Granulibacter bethesdensis]|nr:hypothetical protein GbCGDNIH6_8309 [Granulibacter bethesdensis]
MRMRPFIRLVLSVVHTRNKNGSPVNSQMWQGQLDAIHPLSKYRIA